MKLFRRKAEQRAETEERGYTETRTAEDTAAVSTVTADPVALAAAQSAAGHWGRGFAAATLEPNTPATEALNPAVMYEIGRALCLYGECVYMVTVDGGRVSVVRAADWDINGVLVWNYRLTLSGPSGTVIRRAGAASVLHFRINQGASDSHKGCSPFSGLTGDLAAALETQLKNEASSNHGRLIPAPIEGFDDADLADLKGDLANLKGASKLVPSMERGFGSGNTPTGSADWAVRRLFMDPAEAAVRLRRDLVYEIYGSAGVPPSLALGGSDSSAVREAYRIFQHSTLAPLGRVVAAEISRVMEVDARMNFDALFASDTQGRARAFRSLIGNEGGMDQDEAARLTGLS